VVAHSHRLHQGAKFFRHVFRQRHDARGRNRKPLGKGRWDLSRNAEDDPSRAPLFLTGQACRAGVAGHHRVDGHQLADRQSCHVYAEFSNPADGLVSHDLARVAATVLAGIAVKVRAADAGGDHFDHCLARPRHRIGPFLNRDVVEVAQYQRSHVPTWETCEAPALP
jgi:hypothetical protein